MRIALFLRSLLFYLLLGLAVIGVIPLLVVGLVLPGTRRNQLIARWSAGLLAILQGVCGVGYEVSGLENIPARNGVILCKHQSAWETFALQVIFPAQVWVLKRELLWIPIFGWGLKVMGAIAIDRRAGNRALRQVIAQGSERLKRGLWVVVFPEGTRTPPGERGRYNPGGAMLAARSGFPVVPVAHNAGEYWPAKGFVIRPGTVQVVVGPALEPEGLKASELNQQVEDWIERQMTSISVEKQQVGEKTAHLFKAENNKM